MLELAVGTGRLAVPLAADGWNVTGIDSDPAMLARAGGAAAHAGVMLELIEGDLVTAELGARFAFVFLALNGLLLMADVGGQAAALRSIARHLRPGGLAAIDVWLPGAEDLALYDGRLLLEWVRDDTERATRVAKYVSATYDGATAIVELRSLFDEWSPADGVVHRGERVDRLRLIGQEELIRLAAEAELAVDQLAGDYQLTPFGAGSERVVLIARLV